MELISKGVQESLMCVRLGVGECEYVYIAQKGKKLFWKKVREQKRG